MERSGIHLYILELLFRQGDGARVPRGPFAPPGTPLSAGATPAVNQVLIELEQAALDLAPEVLEALPGRLGGKLPEFFRGEVIGVEGRIFLAMVAAAAATLTPNRGGGEERRQGTFGGEKGGGGIF